MKLEFHDPSGTMEVTREHAPRLESLAGKRIALVSNSMWQAYRILPKLQEMFEADFPDVEVIPADEFPQGTAHIGTEKTAQLIKDRGIHAAIIGSAA